ncbi:energy transducer TonB [Herbaspirillum autotrophicum]|uniref:energy transducer TonB n=1 Tax=Herbaspirillum autotrophicum TaxID=180195 RepID=UPI000AB61923|nr:TonB family protein [Herbaspirillum autotrophicum]
MSQLPPQFMPQFAPRHAAQTVSQPLLFRFRQTAAGLPALLMLAALIVAGIRTVATVQQHHDDAPVQISLVSTAPEPVPAPITPPPPKPLLPAVIKPLTPPPVTPPTPRPPTPAVSTVTPSARSNPEFAAAAPAAKTPEAPVVAAPVAATPTPAAAAAAPAAARPHNAEAEYVARLRAHLNSIKRYPTGREASLQRPQGKVRVWFVLKRDGALVDAGIEESSNSMLLDDAARKTINRSNFSGFPESSWAGENTHRFTAELEFIPAG